MSERIQELLSAVFSHAQDSEPKPALSKAPLTAEEVDIYRTFLQLYVKDGDGFLNVANVTDSIGFSPADIKEHGCLKGVPHESLRKANSIVHRLDPRVAMDLKIKLVDPADQKIMVKQNDPRNAMGKSEKELDNALQTAFASGLFTFSEIAFDNGHTMAVLTFSFYCGALCGHGGLLLFHKKRPTLEAVKAQVRLLGVLRPAFCPRDRDCG